MNRFFVSMDVSMYVYELGLRMMMVILCSGDDLGLSHSRAELEVPLMSVACSEANAAVKTIKPLTHVHANILIFLIWCRAGAVGSEKCRQELWAVLHDEKEGMEWGLLS